PPRGPPPRRRSSSTTRSRAAAPTRPTSWPPTWRRGAGSRGRCRRRLRLPPTTSWSGRVAELIDLAREAAQRGDFRSAVEAAELAASEDPEGKVAPVVLHRHRDTL